MQSATKPSSIRPVLYTVRMPRVVIAVNRGIYQYSAHARSRSLSPILANKTWFGGGGRGAIYIVSSFETLNFILLWLSQMRNWRSVDWRQRHQGRETMLPR